MACAVQPVEETTVTLMPVQAGALAPAIIFNRFDTLMGTRQLISVEVSTEISLSFNAGLENLFSGPQTVMLTASPGVQIVDTVANGGVGHIIDLDPMQPGDDLVIIVPVSEQEAFPAFDTLEDFDGDSGTTFMGAVLSNANSLLTNQMDLDRFTRGSGAGPMGGVKFDLTSQGAGFTCFAPFDAACDLTTLIGVEMTVRYTFSECDIMIIPPPCKEINRREPGSLLLFPEYKNTPGNVTVFTVTNANCDFFDGHVDVEFRYIDGDNCLESNLKETLTPCDTITFLTSAHAGSDQGYAYAYARDSTQNTSVNPAGTPIVFNHLVGHALVVNGWQSVEYSLNAVSFKALGVEGSSTDRESPGPVPGVIGDGIRDLDGVEYDEAPDKILIPRFLGQSPVLQQRGFHSDLILIALSGGRLFQSSPVNPSGGTTILVHGWNDNEVMFSLEHTFDCWQKLRLGLLRSGDVITPVPGTTAFDNLTLAGFGNDPNEINGAPGLESGWFTIDGLTASSTVESITDPAVYAVLIETVRGHSAADLPFEYCSQPNGDLLPGSIFGDYNAAVRPHFNNMDNQ